MDGGPSSLQPYKSQLITPADKSNDNGHMNLLWNWHSRGAGKAESEEDSAKQMVTRNAASGRWLNKRHKSRKQEQNSDLINGYMQSLLPNQYVPTA